MLSNEERVAAVKRRSKELEIELKQKAQIRRGQIIRLSSMVASVVLIAMLSFAVPMFTSNFASKASLSSSMAASIFHGGGALGYIVVGLLAFSLGVCVTMVCQYTKQPDSENAASDASPDDTEEREKNL